jgi:hypothetical protein
MARRLLVLTAQAAGGADSQEAGGADIQEVFGAYL